jgi:hypothetical protein
MPDNKTDNKSIDHNLTPLTHDKAIEALKNGERLVNGKERYDVAHYHLYQGRILISDSYYDLVGEGTVIEENDLPQLYRVGDGIFGGTGTEVFDNADEKLKTMITKLLESNNYPCAIQQFGIEGLKSLIITIANDKGCSYTKKELLSSLTMIEDSLRENSKHTA